MNILLTRPHEDSVRFAARLASCGVTTEVAPLLTIHPVAHAPIDLGRVQAVLLTSANGARALADATAERDCAVLAVGDATARVAREAGFGDVASASGDVASLTTIAAARLNPGDGPVLHIAGSAVAGDLAGGLGARGFAVERCVAYRATTAATLPDNAVDGLRADRFDGAAFFSPRTAATFARQIEAAGLSVATERLHVFCLSDAVAVALQGTRWRAGHVPPRPESEALARLICEAAELP
ncbi:MAG: uroporphyrinogen-III synthase [Rhodospirillales bacterium]|nr:uroporphyrinogen-III synthase [Rhodospirillales bacterium]